MHGKQVEHYDRKQKKIMAMANRMMQQMSNFQQEHKDTLKRAAEAYKKLKKNPEEL